MHCPCRTPVGYYVAPHPTNGRQGARLTAHKCVYLNQVLGTNLEIGGVPTYRHASKLALES